MTQKDIVKSKELLGSVSPEDWVPKGATTVSYNFGLIDEAAVNPHVYLNPLFNMAELREVNQGETLFSNDFLRSLRDKVVDFATVGKVTAQQLPLPRPELVRGGYIYDTGAHTYQAKEITPGFHASPKFLHENIKVLPISDFQNVIVATKIDKDQKKISVQKIPTRKSCESIIRSIKSPTSAMVFDAQFDEASHGTPWSVSIWSDAANPSTHWVEVMVKTAEQFGSRREHATPYVVEIEASHEDIKQFSNSIHKAIETCNTPLEQHRLLNYLASVLYFQSDPEMPYISPDVKPGILNKQAPYDLFNLPMGGDRSGIENIPDLIDRAMQAPDGFKAIETLCNGGVDDPNRGAIDVSTTTDRLKDIFGGDYDQLADLVKREMRDMGTGIKDRVQKEVASRTERNAEFDSVWGETEPKIIKSLADALGFKNIDTDQAQLQQLKEMMNLENLRSAYKSQNRRGDLALSEEINWLNRELIATTMSKFMKDSITSILKAPIPALKKIGVKNTFVKAWKQIRDDAALMFAISPQQMNDALRSHVRSDNSKIEEIFDEELRQANLTKSFK